VYIDIHSHIIPGVDDGVRDEAMSLKMLRIAHDCGTRHIIATPHYFYGNTRYEFADIKEKCEHLNNIAKNAGLNITVYPGCEVFITPEIVELYDQGLIGTLAGSCYMLIEFPRMSIPPYTDTVLYHLQLKGITPVIAHPERYIEIQQKPELMGAYVERGILLQANSRSITGMYGLKAKRTVMRLIKEGWVHFVASDAHSANSCNPDLANAAARIEKKFGLKMRESLFTLNALKIFEH
jgi:protein-tyrosine phosphatase